MVIGNSNYDNVPLKNTVNDAYDVSTAFNDLGYSVYTLLDGNRQEMEELIIKTRGSKVY